MNNAQASSLSRKQPVSVRKVEANRRNALKSTGPKTERGKENSRRNAIKHGLFARQMEDFLIAEDEDLAFRTFHKRLWNELQPLGPREEAEVGYISVCWLRLDRLWRYENAEVRSAQHRIKKDIEEGSYHPCSLVRGRTAIMSLLHSAKEGVEKEGHVSPDLLGKIFKERSSLKEMWASYRSEEVVSHKKNIGEIAKTIANERKISLPEARLLLSGNPESVSEFTRLVECATITRIMLTLFGPWMSQSQDIERTAPRLQAIPDRAVEKVIRYGNAIERQLSRAYARLDRLQSRRKGEPVHAPLVDVYLTR